VEPRARLDTIKKRKCLLLPGIEPWPSSLYPIAIPTHLSDHLKLIEHIRMKLYFLDSCVMRNTYMLYFMYSCQIIPVLQSYAVC
jgi:hypothetical protein